MEKVDDPLGVLVFFAAAVSLFVIFWSLVLAPSSIFSFLLLTLFLKLDLFFSHQPWHRRHNPWGKEYGLVKLLPPWHIKNDLNKSWCICSLWNVYFFLNESITTLFISFLRFLIHFHSLGSKDEFAKIDLILKYVVL